MVVPLYRRVYEDIRQRIKTGFYARGGILPSEARLTDEYGVSLITVRRALDELALDGLVERRQGVGTFVRNSARNVLIGMSSFTYDIASGRLRLVRTLLQDDIVTASLEVAQKLGVQTGSMLRHLVRLDAEGGVPISVDEVFMPPALAVTITPEIASSPLFIDVWEERSGVVLVRIESEICVQASEKADQEVLQIGPDVPLLVTGDLIFDVNQRAAMWVVTRYRSDRCRLTVTAELVHQRKTVVSP
ncbi:MAG: GntR family transcriptional regulator [Anaerolineae bacterium]|nr:GntR family transcriptional regulator [Anaerolineae bacterium]